MLVRMDYSITEEQYRQGKTLLTASRIGDATLADTISLLLPNMNVVLTFKTCVGDPVNFYMSEEEFLELTKTDFYEITKASALQAQKNTIAEAREDKRTPLTDYLYWVNATEILEEALDHEKKVVEDCLGKQKND